MKLNTSAKAGYTSANKEKCYEFNTRFPVGDSAPIQN